MFHYLKKKNFHQLALSISVRVRKSEVLKCKCATLLVTCVRWIGKSPVSTESPLSLQHRRWTHYQSEGCQVQHGQTGGEEFRERITPPLAKLLRCWVLYTTEPKWILQIFYANSHWYMWRPKGEEKEKEWQREYERARETEEDREQHIFQGTAPCCSNLIVFSEKGWSVREIHLFFSTGKCGIDRWTLCSSVTAQCKVMQERQTHSLYHKKVCSCLRSVSCMRIHELHWPPFNTFSWDEYRQWCYASVSCENHLQNRSKTLLIVVSTLPHSHIIQSLDTLIPCQNLYHFISFKLQLQTLHGNILQTFKLRNESSRWD